MNLFKIGLAFSGFSIPLVTELFILIDAGIYGIVSATMEGFFDMIKVSYQMFGKSGENGFEIVSALISRIMALCGIYALFRISLMMINYLIDPSKLKQAEKTGIDIAKNAFIAIILLLTSTFIFQKLGELQELVFESNVIEKIVYGNTGEQEHETIKNSSKKFANNMWLLFFTKKETASTECINKVSKIADGSATILSAIGCHYKHYDYFPIAPFIVGILLIYYFISYTIELVIRMIKLLVLEIISPIPIILSIDPSQKNRLSKFISAYIPIYLQVFIRVFTFYIAFALAYLILNNAKSILEVQGDLSIFLKVFIVIGIFQGMKELPKLLENAIGLKLDGGRTKPFGQVVSGIVGGTAGLIGGTAAGIISGGGVGGAVLGGLKGLSAGAGSKNWGQIKKNAVAGVTSASTLGRNIRTADGFAGYMGGMLRSKTGYQQRADNKVNQAQRKKDQLEKMREAMEKAYADEKIKYTDANGNTFEKKRGTIDEDIGVMNAKADYQAYLDTQAENGEKLDGNIVAQLRKNITDAETAYKNEALNYFAKQNQTDRNGNIELKDASGKVLDPIRDYDSLTESQRLYADYTRMTKEKMDGTNFATNFNTLEKNAKEDLKTAKKGQESIGYQHAKAYKNK